MTDSKLKAYVERIDRLMTTMDETREDIAKVIKEAKGDGYIPKTLRKVATRYHADPDKIATEDALLETYEAALGRVGKALAAIRGGATWEEARKAHDVPRATLARAAAVSKQREVIPAHEAPVAGSGPGAQPGTPDSNPPGEGIGQQETRDVAQRQAEAGQDAGQAAGAAGRGAQLDGGMAGRGAGAAGRSTARGESGGHGDTDSRPVSLGAVASHSDGERVATNTDESRFDHVLKDGLDLPSYLDKRKLAPALKSAPSPRGGSVTTEGTHG